MPNGLCVHKDIGTIKAMLTFKLLIPVNPWLQARSEVSTDDVIRAGFLNLAPWIF